ncbi:MAG: hypothetical protein IPM37_09015 [Hahellaceae bacterium]|nr:hypothetical protein [Hahellaceae bacterium]
MLKTLLEYGYTAYEQMKKAELSKTSATSQAPVSTEARPQHVLLSGETFVPERKLTIPVSQLRFNLGQETAQLQHMLRKKLAEAGIPPGTQVQLRKTEIGTLAVEARLPQDIKDKLERSLNASPEMRIQFNRVSQHKPAVEFVANASRLQKLYGADNQALKSVVSGDASLNSLQDIAQRLQQLRQTQTPEKPSASEEKPFELAISI